MPTISPTTTGTNTNLACVIAWTGMATGDDGSPFEGAQYVDKSVQVTGTFGGATVTIQGSNDGTNWATLTDTANAALTFTSTGLKQITEATRYIRPIVSGGAGSGLAVRLLAKE